MSLSSKSKFSISVCFKYSDSKALKSLKVFPIKFKVFTL